MAVSVIDLYGRQFERPHSHRRSSWPTKIIGCLVADGTDAEHVNKLKVAAEKVGAKVKIVAPKIGGAKSSDGSTITADFQLVGGASVLFDAVYVALTKEAADLLCSEAAAVSWVHDAFAHLT